MKVLCQHETFQSGRTGHNAGRSPFSVRMCLVVFTSDVLSADIPYDSSSSSRSPVGVVALHFEPLLSSRYAPRPPSGPGGYPSPLVHSVHVWGMCLLHGYR